MQINIQHSKHVKEPFREPFYNYISQSRKPSIVFESAVFRQNVSNNFKDKYFRFGWNSFLWNESNFGPMGNGCDRWNHIQEEQQIEIHTPRTANAAKLGKQTSRLRTRGNYIPEIFTNGEGHCDKGFLR